MPKPRARAMANPHGQFEWGRRRRLIYATLLYCLVSGAAVLVAALNGMDSTLLSTITVSNYGLAGATLGSYVFGAVWDDKNAREFGTPIGEAALDPLPAGNEAGPIPEDFAG